MEHVIGSNKHPIEEVNNKEGEWPELQKSNEMEDSVNETPPTINGIGNMDRSMGDV